MLRDHLCPCFGSQISGDTGPGLDPVLLVSGIGGSILHSKKKLFGIEIETRVWVRILFSDMEFKKKLWSLYNPKTGAFLFLFWCLHASFTETWVLDIIYMYIGFWFSVWFLGNWMNDRYI